MVPPHSAMHLISQMGEQPGATSGIRLFERFRPAERNQTLEPMVGVVSKTGERSITIVRNRADQKIRKPVEAETR